MSNKTEVKQSYNLEQIISFSEKPNKVFIKEHEPLNTQKLIVEEVIADFLLLKALMAYEAQCEARALAIEKERFKTIDEANDELCQHIEKMSI